MKNEIIEYSSTSYGFNHSYSINGGYYKFEIGLVFPHFSNTYYESYPSNGEKK